MPLVNIMLGEVVFGGVGSGLYGMLIFVVLSVFIAGLMVGRTPEYLGKKIESYDIKMAMLYVLIFPLLILVLTAVSVLHPAALASLGNNGPHGLSEILYAYVSTAGNNGSAFGGLTTNTNWYNLTLAFNMLAGRFLMMVPMLALAGNLAQKKSVPPSSGTFPVNTTLFTVLLVGVILIVGALTFFPALSLGPDSRAPAAACRKDFLKRRSGETIWQKNKVSGTPRSFANRRWIRFASSTRA